MRHAWRHFIAELIGTFAVTFIAGAVVVATPSHTGWLEIALAQGLAYAAMITALMRISGHLNPAVTVALLATRRIEPTIGLLYILAQLGGASLAALVVTWTTHVAGATAPGVQSLSLSVSTPQAMLLEALATFLVIFATFGSIIDTAAPRVGGFAVGAAYATGILAIGPFTGGALNPARALGPALVENAFDGQAAYWIGPLVGAIAAGLLYERVFLHRSIEPASHGAMQPRE